MHFFHVFSLAGGLASMLAIDSGHGPIVFLDRAAFDSLDGIFWRSSVRFAGEAELSISAFVKHDWV
jgi:hypothetical protein